MPAGRHRRATINAQEGTGRLIRKRASLPAHELPNLKIEG